MEFLSNIYTYSSTYTYANRIGHRLGLSLPSPVNLPTRITYYRLRVFSIDSFASAKDGSFLVYFLCKMIEFKKKCVINFRLPKNLISFNRHNYAAS